MYLLKSCEIEVCGGILVRLLEIHLRSRKETVHMAISGPWIKQHCLIACDYFLFFKIPR